MKSAVELAFYELKKHNGGLLSRKDVGNNRVDLSHKTSADDIMEQSIITAVKEKEDKMKNKLGHNSKRVKELEEELAMMKQKHEEDVAAIKSKHVKETKKTEKNYADFVSKMVKSHRKEINSLKKSLKEKESSHKAFLESYVEASVDALRNYSDSPSL